MSLQPTVPVTSPEQPLTNTANSPVLHSAPAASANGSAFPKASHLPRAGRRRKIWPFVLAGVAVVLVVVAGGGLYAWFHGPQLRPDLLTAKVEYKDLQLKIVERGTLEAKDNHDIKCEVKTGSRGAPKIKWVVDNGQLVKKGDLLIEIDDSYLQEQATNQKIQRDNAETAMISAKQTYPVKKSAIGLAEQNLDKWIKGDYPQQLHDLEGQIQIADSVVLQQEDRTAWVSRMVKKGYMNASQAESEEANLNGDRLSFQKLQEQKKVLIDFTNPVQQKTLKNAIESAKNDETTAYATQLSTQAVFDQQDMLYKDLVEQIKQCKVYAQNEGIVVYATTEQSQRGAGATQSIIAQGEPVAYGQKMMSIPDLSRMLVNVRVHEAFINHMEVKPRVETVKSDGPADKAGIKPGDIIVKMGPKTVRTYTDLVDSLRGHKPNEKVKLKVLRDKDMVDVELTFAPLAEQPKSGAVPSLHRGLGADFGWYFGAEFQIGLPAMVRVEAVAGRALKAHVKSVANVAAPQDWMSPDVKVYQAYVEIDESVEELKLKPGLSAVSTIFTESKVDHVLAVPVQAIVSPLEKGGKPRCFVLTPHGPEMRELELGMTDEKNVEVKSGVKEGEDIVLNPRTLLNDKDKKAVKEDEKMDKGGKQGQGKGKGKAGGDGQMPADHK